MWELMRIIPRRLNILDLILAQDEQTHFAADGLLIHQRSDSCAGWNRFRPAHGGCRLGTVVGSTSARSHSTSGVAITLVDSDQVAIDE